MLTKRHLLLLLILATLTAGQANGQIIYGQPPAASSGFVFTSWTLDSEAGGETSLSQFWLPLTGFMPISDDLEVRAWLATASNQLKVNEIDSSLSGMGDMRATVSRAMANDRYVVSLGINLPTGKSKLDPDSERPIIEYLSQSFLDFPMRRYGEGFGFNLLFGMAGKLGNISGGTGVRYEYIGSYEPYAGVEEYDPGDMVSLYAGGDMPQGDFVWSGNISYTLFTEDQLAGTKVLKQGDQLDLQVGVVRGPREGQLRGSIHYILRDRNARYDASGDIIEQLKLYGDEIRFGLSYAYSLTSDIYLVPSIALRSIESNEKNLGSSSVTSLGTTVGKQLNDAFNLKVGFKYLTGTANGGAIDLTGMQLSSRISATL